MGSIRQGPGGYWFIDYTDGNGKRTRESSGSKNKSDAKAALQSRETDVRRGKFDGVHAAKVKRTLGSVVEKYCTDSRGTKAARTCRRDVEIIKATLLPRFGARTLDSITTEDLTAYRTQRLRVVAPATVNKEVQLLTHIAKVNGVAFDKLRPLKTPAGRVRWLTPEEIPRLLDACAPWLRDIVRVAMFTGMRLSEILELETRRVDIQAGTIRLDTSKNGDARIIPIHDCLKELLMVRTVPAHGRKVNDVVGGRVFRNQFGRDHNPNLVSRAFRLTARRARISDFKFHDLRHHFASMLAMGGHDVLTIKALLGHRTLAMTMRYAHLSNPHLKKAVASLSF